MSQAPREKICGEYLVSVPLRGSGNGTCNLRSCYQASRNYKRFRPLAGKWKWNRLKQRNPVMGQRLENSFRPLAGKWKWNGIHANHLSNPQIVNSFRPLAGKWKWNPHLLDPLLGKGLKYRFSRGSKN